jgi:hypothetical protein
MFHSTFMLKAGAAREGFPGAPGLSLHHHLDRRRDNRLLAGVGSLAAAACNSGFSEVIAIDLLHFKHLLMINRFLPENKTPIRQATQILPPRIIDKP